MSRAPSFAGVVLAAGASSRMGRDKALLPWRGTTFLAAAIEALKPHTDLVIVVAGANSESLRPVVDASGAFLVVNPEPERGQFSSLQTGLREVLNRGRDAAIIALVDRPPAQHATIARLREHYISSTAWAVVPEFEDGHGHPIVVGREMIEAFLKAAPNTTARDVEHARQEKIAYLPVDDANVTANVDTPEDYAQLNRS